MKFRLITILLFSISFSISYAQRKSTSGTATSAGKPDCLQDFSCVLYWNYYGKVNDIKITFPSKLLASKFEGLIIYEVGSSIDTYEYSAELNHNPLGLYRFNLDNIKNLQTSECLNKTYICRVNMNGHPDFSFNF